jgi:hypothetical protein
VAVLCAACADAVGPDRLREAQLAITPHIASNPTAIVDIADVWIRLSRAGATTPFLDTLVAVSPDQTVFDLSLTVTLTSESETLFLSLILLDTDGLEVYRDEGNPTPVTVGASATPEPIDVPIAYVGPGASAVRLEIIEPTELIYTGDAIQLEAVAYDAADQVIANAPVGWVALDPIVAFDEATPGLMHAGSLAGTTQIVANLPRVREGAALITDTATVSVRINQPPDEVSIGSPVDGASFIQGSDVTFTGSATDPDEGALTGE